MSFVGTVLVASTVLLAAAALAAWSLRKASASTRHALWAISMGGLLLLPLAEGLLPKLELPVLPPLPAPEEAPVGELAPSVSPSAGPGVGSSAMPVSPILPPSTPGEGEALEAPVRTAAESSLVGWTWLDGLLAVWTLGALIVMARLLIGTWSVRRLWSRATGVADEGWRKLLDDLRSRMGVRGTVDIRISDAPIPPMTLGVFGRAILLPRDAAGWSHDRRLAVLAHELAHLRRRDGLTQMLVQLVQALYWFHPLAWYAVRRLADERERAADDQVLALDTRRGDYAEHLVAVTRAIGSGVSLATLTMAEPSRLEARVLAILDPETSRQAVSRFAIAFLALAVLLPTLSAATFRLTAMALMPEGSEEAANPEPLQGGLQPEDGRAIHGTVRVAGTGTPLAPATVTLRYVGSVPPGGERISRSTITDDNGRFEFTGLSSGPYQIQAGEPGWGIPRTVSLGGVVGSPPNVSIWAVPSGSVSGTVTTQDGEGLPGALVRLATEQWLDGERVLSPVHYSERVETAPDGHFTVVAPPGTYRIEVSDASRTGEFPPHYYPGTLMPADGVPVRIASGVDLSGLDVVLTDAPQKRVSLTSPISPEVAELVEPDNPIEAYFWLRESGIRRREMQRHILERDGDDRYLTGPLGPGEYLVVMRYDLRPGVRTSGLDLTAIDPIAVFSISIEEDAPEMIDLGVIVPQTYPSVQGSLTVESDDRSLRDLALAGEVPELALIPRAVGGSYNTTIETDGQFQLARVPPGFYKLHINGIPDGWYVSRASSGGRDILNDGMLVEGAVSPLDVRLAEGTGRIAGFVRNRDSQPVADSRVLLIPPVPLRGPFTQYPTTVSDEAGAWALEGVPPGSYRVVALELLGLEAVGEEVQRGVYRYWQSPDFLRQYELRGELITVDPGARLTINPEAIPLVD